MDSTATMIAVAFGFAYTSVMQLQLITQQGGQLFTQRSPHASVSPLNSEHARQLHALATTLETVPPDMTVWCHVANNGLILDAANDAQIGFGRIAWDQAQYWLERYWPLHSAPSAQNLVWVAAQATHVGIARDRASTCSMLADLLADAPRHPPTRRMRAIGRHPSVIDLTVPLPFPWYPKQIAHNLEALRQSFIEQSATASPRQAPYLQRMALLLDYLQTTTIANLMFIERSQDGILLTPEHAEGEGMTIRPAVDGYTVNCGWFPQTLPTWQGHSFVTAHAGDPQSAGQLAFAAYTYK